MPLNAAFNSFHCLEGYLLQLVSHPLLRYYCLCCLETEMPTVTQMVTHNSKEKIIARADPDTNIVFVKPDCFPADNPRRGQWSGEDVSVGAVRSGKVHPRLLLRYSGHWIHGVCMHSLCVCVYIFYIKDILLLEL